MIIHVMTMMTIRHVAPFVDVIPLQLLSELCEMSLPFSPVLTVILDELARSIYSDFFVSQDGSLAFDQVRPPKHPSDEPLIACMPRHGALANRWAQAEQQRCNSCPGPLAGSAISNRGTRSLQTGQSSRLGGKYAHSDV
jgi:hypothetical protein